MLGLHSSGSEYNKSLASYCRETGLIYSQVSTITSNYLASGHISSAVELGYTFVANMVSKTRELLAASSDRHYMYKKRGFRFDSFHNH